MQALKIIGLLLIIVVALGSIAYQAQRLDRKPVQQGMMQAKLAQMESKMMAKMGPMGPMAGSGMGRGGNRLGNKDAKVIIEASIPLEVDCHSKTVKLLKALVQEEPQRVYVKILNHSSPEGLALAGQHGISCASVFVNGQFKFDLQDPQSQIRHVEFWHRPNDPDSSYHSEDVIDAVNEKLAEEYGKGLSESVLAKIKAAGKEATPKS